MTKLQGWHVCWALKIIHCFWWSDAFEKLWWYGWCACKWIMYWCRQALWVCSILNLPKLAVTGQIILNTGQQDHHTQLWLMDPNNYQKQKKTSNKLKCLLPNPSMALDLANDIQVVVGFKRIFPLSLSLCLMTLNPNTLSKDVPQEPKTDSSNCTTCGGTHMNENSLNIARMSRTTSQDAKGMLDQILSSSLKECLCVSIYEIVAHASLHSARASSNLWPVHKSPTNVSGGQPT